jgi:predicted O-methyltransferase YrrM
VLASAVPPNGRILEIGTGAGVGTAWIAAGLGERTDVELVTIEADPRMISAVRAWEWPDYVEILMADASDVIDTLGAFNLVFADAAPVKYRHIDSVFAALQPRGILVIDDLEPGAQTSDLQRTEKAELRRAIFGKTSLRGVEIATSTGVIMAARE